MSNPVLESTKFVTDQSTLVSVNRKTIKEVATKWKKENWQLPPWDFHYHFFDNSPRTLTYLLLLDSINFSFWPSSAKATEGKLQKSEKKYRRMYQGKELGGYNSLALSLKFAFLRNHPIEKAEHLLRLRKGEFLTLLNGKGKLPLLEKRLHILHQNGLILKKNFQGEFVNVVKEAKGDALKLIRLLVSNFPHFNDVSQFQGKPVMFHKRAELLINDIYTVFQGKGLGELINMDKLTAFADYKLPQILRHWNILQYEKTLAKQVDARLQLQKGSREEIEIRANTIWAVEYLKEELKKQGINLQSREIDWFLWKQAREEKGMKSYHRVRTIYY